MQLCRLSHVGLPVLVSFTPSGWKRLLHGALGPPMVHGTVSLPGSWRMPNTRNVAPCVAPTKTYSPQPDIADAFDASSPAESAGATVLQGARSR